MNFILISPAFPYNFKPFAYELKKKGLTVLGIGDTPIMSWGMNYKKPLQIITLSQIWKTQRM